MSVAQKTQKGGQAVVKQPDSLPSAVLQSLNIANGITRITGTSAHVALAREIGQRIVHGVFAPGATLPNEAQWAEAFGVSRSVVRESVKMLMAKGLLLSRPRVGSRVEPREKWNLLDRDVLSWYAAAPDKMGFLKTVQEFRYIIEPEACALAAMRRSDAQMADISQACYDMGTAQSLARRTAADTRFHLAILRAAGNDLLLPLGAMINSALDQLFAFITREVNDLRYAQDLHEDINLSIRRRQPDAARMAARRLLENTDSVIARCNTSADGHRQEKISSNQEDS
jgi:DNA-binding FadR family transcriptional regulator